MRRGCDVMTSNRINVVFAVMMNSSGKGTMLIWNGIPIGMHLALWAYSPWPPWACSAIFSSWMRLNSSFNGACCAAPAGLLGSYRGPPPIAFQRHWPDQSGYLDSSCAEAAVAVANVAAIVSTPIRIRTIMGVLPARVSGTEHRGGGLSAQNGNRVEEAKWSHPLSRDFPGGTLMLKRVVAILGAAQKVRKPPGTLAGDGDLGHLEG